MANITDLITSKLEFFLHHDFVKNAQAKSFQDQKKNWLKMKSSIILISLKIINLFHKMKYKVVIGIINGCTLFTVLVHYKDANDCLQHESFVLVSDYMNHDKYAVLVFLEQISDKFKNLHPDITITKKYFRSDGAGQNFKQKYTICSMSLMKEEIKWDFNATSHGKGDIDGLGGTCKRRIREKTRARIIDPQTSLDFAVLQKFVPISILSTAQLKLLKMQRPHSLILG